MPFSQKEYVGCSCHAVLDFDILDSLEHELGQMAQEGCLQALLGWHQAIYSTQ